MPALKSSREDRFAHLVALGRKPHEALKQAGLSDRTASTYYRLLNKESVQARIKELLQEFHDKCLVELEELTAHYRHARDLALAKDDVQGIVAANTALAKLHGFLVDKSVSLHGDVNKLAALPRDAVERLHRLLGARQAERLAGANRPVALTDQTLQLSAVSKTEGVSCGGQDTPRDSAYGVESVSGAGDGSENGSRGAPDR